MTILASDMQAYPSAVVSADPATNGGGPGANPLALNAKNAVFPDIGLDEKASGSRVWRKIFLANTSSDALTGSTYVLLDWPTLYAPYAYFVPGTRTDVEAHIPANPEIYGAAYLAAAAAVGDTSISVALAHADLSPMFAAGRRILVSNRATWVNTTGTVGTEETHGITAVSVSGLTATLTLDSPLAAAYPAAANTDDPTLRAGGRVCVLYQPGVITPVGDAPASVPIWLCRVVPAGATRVGDPGTSVGWLFESAGS